MASTPSIVERDYILAHVVAQLHGATPKDGGTLIFKGGTALRFIHIGDYRYSADLDFTLIGGEVGPAIAALGDVLEAARQHAALPFLELTDDDKPAISYVGPFGGAKPRHIKLDVATDEHVESIVQRTVLEVWPDLPDALPFAVYSTEEIGAEKLRCIIQRVQCRDLYDLFRLTEDVGVSLAEIRPLFERKARAMRFAMGVSMKVISKTLGHSSERVMSEVYVHLQAEHRIVVADAMTRALWGQLALSGAPSGSPSPLAVARTPVNVSIAVNR